MALNLGTYPSRFLMTSNGVLNYGQPQRLQGMTSTGISLVEGENFGKVSRQNKKRISYSAY